MGIPLLWPCPCLVTCHLTAFILLLSFLIKPDSNFEYPLPLHFLFKNKNAWQAILYRLTVFLFMLIQHVEDKTGADSGGKLTAQLTRHPLLLVMGTGYCGLAEFWQE